jgi:hypothetical protein
MAVYVALIVLTLLIVVLYETDLLESGVLSESKQTEFIAVTMMELVTLSSAFLALRLFKFKKIHEDLLKRKEQALLPKGLLRIALLGVPMAVNTYLYYIYMNATFGYLAIILLLCLPFVFPSMDRCLTETEK